MLDILNYPKDFYNISLRYCNLKRKILKYGIFNISTHYKIVGDKLVSKKNRYLSCSRYYELNYV